METATGREDLGLGRQLILDELFDVSLYKALRTFANARLRNCLDELIPIETRHYGFWQDYYGLRIERLDPGRRFKLAVIRLICRIFGEPAIHLTLEVMEINGIRKYLAVWRSYKGKPLADAIKVILEDEFKHEEQAVSRGEEIKLSPEQIRVIFLGFNDGLVEFVGAVGGFFAAFQDVRSVLIASLTGAAAGAFSMAVGVYASSSSEGEMEAYEAEKEHFLSDSVTPAAATKAIANPFISAVSAGMAYLFGAMVPVLPVFFGAKSVLLSWISGGIMAVIVTAILSFISSMRIRRRILMNLVLLFIAVTASFTVGYFVKKQMGIA